MSKTTLFAAAAAATLLGSLTSFTPTAEAGGFRLGFGMPIGSFVATPTRGGYASNGYSSGRSCKKKSMSYASRSQPKAASRPSKETKVASHSAPKKSRSVDRAESNETQTADNTNETGTTGSTALIQADSNKADITTVEIPADLPPEGSTPAATTTTETTETSTPVASAEADTEIPAAETPAPAPAPVVEEAPKSKKSKTAKKEDCTKYIPSIGVTVSVGC